MSYQSALFAFAEGTFVTGSAVFFTQVVGLTAAQVGLGLTAAGVASFLLAVPMGRWADKFGPRRAWAAAALGQAGLYAIWPVIDNFAAFLVMMVILELAAVAGFTARSAYALGIFSADERVRSRAYIRVAMNIGFTVGAGASGIALVTGSDTVIRLVPLLTAALLVGNSLLIYRLPDVPPGDEPDDSDAAQLLPKKALRNRGFLALSVFDGVLGTNQVLLNFVIPLWLVQETDAPRVLLACLFGTNTVLAVLLQVAASRGINSVATSLRAARISAAFFVVSCALVALSHDSMGILTIALVWIGHITLTGAELFQSAASWGFQAELSDPRRLGEYQGAAHVGTTLGSVWAPAAFTYLALERGALGWAAIAVVVIVAVVFMPAASRAAARYVERDLSLDPPMGLVG